MFWLRNKKICFLFNHSNKDLLYNHKKYIEYETYADLHSCSDPEVGGGGGGGGGAGSPEPPPPLKNHKTIWFLSNTGPDHLENYKATKPAVNVRPLMARQGNAI